MRETQEKEEYNKAEHTGLCSRDKELFRAHNKLQRLLYTARDTKSKQGR